MIQKSFRRVREQIKVGEVRETGRVEESGDQDRIQGRKEAEKGHGCARLDSAALEKIDHDHEKEEIRNFTAQASLAWDRWRQAKKKAVEIRQRSLED